MGSVVSAPKLIGSVKVQPATVRPGEPVFVQVCDPNGLPYTGVSDVTVTIQGIESPARYLQYTAPGTRTLVARAVKGGVVETATATVVVAGEAMKFRRSLAAPALMAMPVLRVNRSMQGPYVSSFSLKARSRRPLRRRPPRRRPRPHRPPPRARPRNPPRRS